MRTLPAAVVKRNAYDAIYIGPEGVLEGCCSWAR